MYQNPSVCTNLVWCSNYIVAIIVLKFQLKLTLMGSDTLGVMETTVQCLRGVRKLLCCCCCSPKSGLRTSRCLLRYVGEVFTYIRNLLTNPSSSSSHASPTYCPLQKCATLLPMLLVPTLTLETAHPIRVSYAKHCINDLALESVGSWYSDGHLARSRSAHGGVWRVKYESIFPFPFVFKRRNF